MFGNVLSKAQVLRLRESKEIEITPFVEGEMRLAHYPLKLASVLNLGEVGPGGKRKRSVVHDFSDGDYTFSPGEYAVVEVAEYIRIPEGIVGHFLPASVLIEQGFGLTAGKMDPGYGTLDGRRQQLRFGIKNLKDEKNVWSAGERIAYVYFVDLRGLNSSAYEWSPAELKFLTDRFPRLVRDADSGISHGDGSGERSR